MKLKNAVILFCLTAVASVVAQPFAYVPVPAAACNLDGGQASVKGDKGEMGRPGKQGVAGVKGRKGSKGDSAQQLNLEDISRDLASAKDELQEIKKENMFLKEHMFFSNCGQAKERGFTLNGVYNLLVPFGNGSVGMRVVCDQTTDGGRWTVIQRRIDGSVDFERLWTDYEHGFGRLDGEYWLGLRNIHVLTSSGNVELRIIVEDFENQSAYASYGNFSIGSAADLYRLGISAYTGTAGDSLRYHNSAPFSTSDRDNDSHSINCASRYRGAWWYKGCHYSNLNGYHFNSINRTPQGIDWRTWKNNRHYSNNKATMMIRISQ